MRLADYEPEWVTWDDRKVGVRFWCPHCRKWRIEVLFANAVGDEKPALKGPQAPPLWRRDGETFEALTLAPSIVFKEHWHGYVREGQLLEVR